MIERNPDFDVPVDELHYPEYEETVDVTLPTVRLSGSPLGFYIPKDIVQEYDLAGDDIDFLVHIGSGLVFEVSDNRVSPDGLGGHASIPRKASRRHGLQVGDYVDIHIDGVVARDLNE